MRRLAAVPLLLVLATCSGSKGSKSAECAVDIDGYFQLNGLVPVGEPVTYTIGVPRVCTSLDGITTQVSVLDPAQNLVPHQAELVLMKSWLEVRVTFTPTVPGIHHVTGRFNPNLGSNEGDVIAVAEGGSGLDAGMLLPSVLSSCGFIEFTPGGLTVCRGGSSTRIFAGDTLVQELELFSSALAGGVLWSAAVERWVEGTQADGGRGFRREPDERLRLGSNLGLSGPTQTDVVVSAHDVRHVRVVDGGFVVDDLGLPPQNANGLPAWWRSGNTVLGVTVPMGCSDAGFGFRVCGMPPGPGGFEPAGAWYPNEAIGFASFDEVNLVRADETITLQVPKGIRTARRALWNMLPTFTLDGMDAGTFVPRYRNGGIELIRFTAEIRNATPEWVFLNDPLRAVRQAP